MEMQYQIWAIIVTEAESFHVEHLIHPAVSVLERQTKQTSRRKYLGKQKDRDKRENCVDA